MVTCRKKRSHTRRRNRDTHELIKNRGTFGVFGSVSPVFWGRFTIFWSCPWGRQLFGGRFTIFWSSPWGFGLYRHHQAPREQMHWAHMESQVLSARDERRPLLLFCMNKLIYFFHFAVVWMTHELSIKRPHPKSRALVRQTGILAWHRPLAARRILHLWD